MGCSSTKQSKKTESTDQTSVKISRSKTVTKKAEKLPTAKQSKSHAGDLHDVANDVHQSMASKMPTANSKPLQSKPKTWTDEELLCKLKLLDRNTSSNIVRLLDEGNTIPFICRYRRELIANLGPDE